MFDDSIVYSSQKTLNGLEAVKQMMNRFYQENPTVYWRILSKLRILENKVEIDFEMTINNKKIRGVETLTVNKAGLIDKVEVRRINRDL